MSTLNTKKKVKKIKKYNVTLDVFMMEHIYDVEASSRAEALAIAKRSSEFYGTAELTLFEIEEA